ncbi:MAG: DHA2 family efflux MFS transporter permease subunit [Proteobacteria bacterium]|nr:DHA2 family efflux MFS transporter permease subunit [Pseudomonadota bacterium]
MSATAASAPQGELPPLRGASLWILTVGIAMATLMEILDMTIVNVSIPHISGSLGVSITEGTWTISSYQLASAVMQPLTGWIGRRFGEVRTFNVSIILFILFSALCGLAVNMPMLVACRLLQGLVSGPIMALGQALLLRNYPVHKRGLALGLWGMVVILAPICGPILGGIITDNLSWPWLFYINVPVGVLAAVMVSSTLKGRESFRVKLPIDVVGIALLVIGVASLQFMLDKGNDLDWFGSPVIVTAAVVSTVCLVFLVAWELKDPHPIIDLHFFQRRNFLVSTICIALGYFCFMGSNVIFPLWLQINLGYTATWAGMAVAPVGLLAMVIAPILGRNMHRLDLRKVVTFAFLVFVVSMYWMSALNHTADFLQLAAPRFFQGLGVSSFFLALDQITVSSVSANELASASGIASFVRTMSGSISTAVTVWLWNRRTDFHHAVMTEHVRETAYGWIQFQQDLANLGVSGARALKFVDELLIQQAQTLGVNDMFRLFALVFVFLLPIVWLTRPPFKAAGTGGIH